MTVNINEEVHRAVDRVTYDAIEEEVCDGIYR